MRENQIIVYQVPQPEPLLHAAGTGSRIETKRMHALSDYGLMGVKLYEDVARLGQISTQLRLSGHGQRPLFDVAEPNSRLRQSENASHAGVATISAPAVEKRIYSGSHRGTGREVARILMDHPFRPINSTHQACGLCRSRPTLYKDEVITDDHGGRMFVCSDTDHCERRREAALTDDPILAACRGLQPCRSVHHSGVWSTSIWSFIWAKSWPLSAESGSGKNLTIAECAVGTDAASERHRDLSRSGRRPT